MALDSVSARQGVTAGLTGSAALRAYQASRNESASSASLYQAQGGSAAGRIGPVGELAKGTGVAVAGGTYAAIDADLDARARYLDDVYLSDESKALRAGQGGSSQQADGAGSLFQRAYQAAERTGPDGAGGNLASDVANILGDIVAYARNGLTEVDSETARDDLDAAVKDKMVEALAGRFTEAGLSKDDAGALAGYLSDRIIEGAQAGDTVLNVSLQQAATLTAASRQTGSAAAFGLDGNLQYQSLEHIGGSLALNIAIDTSSGEVKVLQSAAAVHQTGERLGHAGGVRLADLVANGRTIAEGFRDRNDALAAGSGFGGAVGSEAASGGADLADKLRRLVGGSEQLDQAEQAQILVDLLDSLTNRSGSQDEADDADGRDEGGADEARFRLRVPFPPLALGTEADGRASLLFPHQADDGGEKGLGRLPLGRLDQNV